MFSLEKREKDRLKRPLHNTQFKLVLRRMRKKAEENGNAKDVKIINKTEGNVRMSDNKLCSVSI